MGERLSRAVWTILVPFCLLLAVLAVVTIVRESSGGAEADPSANTAGTVEMANIKFAPATLTVARGTEVVFDNKDVAPHTVTADDGSSDSGIIDPGSAYKLSVDEGFSYHCEIHPAMKAEIQLEG
jgi:plastocyanin